MAFTSAQHFMARNMMDCCGLLIVATNGDLFFIGCCRRNSNLILPTPHTSFQIKSTHAMP